MSTILAIETSTELASVALLHNGHIVFRDANGVQNHSQNILPMVQAVLKDADISMAACKAIAFGAGPGSFTGVRTACGVAQGLAFGAGLPLIPVVTLLAMAQSCREQCGADNVQVVLDARMEEVYFAQYRYQDGWHTVVAPGLLTPAAIPRTPGAVTCGNALLAYAPAFEDLPAAARFPEIVPHAREVAALALIELEAGRTVDARDAQPVYLRNKVALTTVERLAKAAA